MLPAKDFLELASEVVGKVKKLTINTRIYGHSAGWRSSNSEDHTLDTAKDIFVVKPKDSTYIELEDLLRVIKYMDKQFKKIDRVIPGRSYFYEGLDFDYGQFDDDYEQLHVDFNKRKYHYIIRWGS